MIKGVLELIIMGAMGQGGGEQQQSRPGLSGSWLHENDTQNLALANSDNFYPVTSQTTTITG